MNDYLHAIAYIIGIITPVFVFPIACVKWRKVALIALIVYLVSYIPFSIYGKHVVANHGGADWREEWVPKYLIEDYTAFSGRTKTRFTLIGTIYWPCIVIDHLVWHRTQEIPYHMP